MTGSETPSHLRMLSAAQLIAWAEGSLEAVRLRTFRDVVPGGFLAALAPVRIDWKTSDPLGEDPFVTLRNVNHGGNPIEKTTVLHQVKVPFSGIAFVEFILVPSTRGGLHALAHHAQLRFVFKPEKRPVLMGLTDSLGGSASHIPDLVLSWETWHASTVRYSGFKGMDPSSFKLSLRVYAGPQRFLEDTLRGRDWFAYRLRMPGDSRGCAELLKVVLALGDGVACDTIATLLDEGEEVFLRQAPPDPETSTAEWQQLRELVMNNKKYDDSYLNLRPGQEGYQTLVRSCATLARYTILTAAKRLVHQGFTEGVMPDALPQPLMGKSTEWMKNIAHANWRGLFIRAPLALAYVIRHPESIPDRIPNELAAAGLMEKREGKAWVVRYSHQGKQPYDGSGMYGKDYAA